MVADSIWRGDTYLGANEIPGGVTVICYHPPPSLIPSPSQTEAGSLQVKLLPRNWPYIRSEGQDEKSRGWHLPRVPYTCRSVAHTHRNPRNPDRLGELPRTMRSWQI